MKKALVLSLFVMLGVGVACSAQLQGQWDTWLKLNLTDPIGLESFYSYLDIQYLVGGWTLEAAAVIDEDGLYTVWFEGFGQLGAFSMWSLAYFNPVDVLFSGFETAAEVSIAGVDLYALFAIQSVDGAIGSGFAIGGIGTAGDIKIGAEVTWNLKSNLWTIWRYGVGYVADWTYTDCSSDFFMPYWEIGGLSVIQSSCQVAFTYLTGVAQFPVCCADVYAMVRFSCASGFEFFSVMAKNVDIGIPWLKIYDVGATYFLDSKVAAAAIQIKTGDIVCFKPYFTIGGDVDGGVLDSIILNALTFTCTLGGCELYWGHIFDPYMYLYSSSWWPGQSDFSYGGTLLMAFNPLGIGLNYDDFYPYCSWVVTVDQETFYPNEVFGIQCDEDSCCGGLFSFGVSNFFLSNDEDGVTGIFGWMGTYVELTVGVGSNVSLVGGMNVSALNGVEFITMGVQVAW